MKRVLSDLYKGENVPHELEGTFFVGFVRNGAVTVLDLSRISN